MPINPGILSQLRPIKPPDLLGRFKAVQDLQSGQRDAEMDQLKIQEAQRQQQQGQALHDALLETGGDIKAALPKIAQVAPELYPHYKKIIDDEEQQGIQNAITARAAQFTNAKAMEGQPGQEIAAAAPVAQPATYPGQVGEFNPDTLGGTQQVAVPLPEQQISGIPQLGVPRTTIRPQSSQQLNAFDQLKARQKLQDEITLKRAQQQAEKEFTTVNPPQPPRLTFEEQTAQSWLAQNPGKTLNDYQTMDANRKKPTINVNNTGQLTDAGLDAAASSFAKTGIMPALGMGNSNMRAQIINRAAEMTPKLDIASNKADFEANKKSLDQATKLSDALKSFESTATKNMGILETSAKKVVDSGSPWINKPLRSIDESALGNTDLPIFRAARQIVVNEVAKLTNNPSLTGQLSDSARHEIESLMPADMTLKQLMALLPVLKQDMANRTSSVDKQVQAIRDRIKGNSGEATHVFNPATGKIEAK